MLKECLENVRANKPLVHNITNYVTVNDVANMLLACGGSPIMAHEVEEVEDIQTICGGLCVNIGTLGMTEAMVLAGKKRTNSAILSCSTLSLPVLQRPEKKLWSFL